MHADSLWILVALITTLAGMGAGYLAWLISKNKKFALRLIDLSAHLFGVISIVGAVVALGAFETNLQSRVQRAELVTDSIDIRKAFETAIRKFCPSDNALADMKPTTDPIYEDCTNIYGYRQRILYSINLSAPAFFPTPPITLKTNSALTAAADITPLIKSHNDKVFEFQENDSGTVNPAEGAAIRLGFGVLLMVSFAFGLGLIRRVLDAASDYKKASNSP
jgi:hypothetical protein